MSDEEYQVRLGAHIRALREAKGISQTELAHHCGFEQPNLSRIESGSSSPSVSSLLKISEALNVDIIDLIIPSR